LLTDRSAIIDAWLLSCVRKISKLNGDGMGFEALDFVIPILFISLGTFVFGTIFVLLGWSRIPGPGHNTGSSGFPKALSALTASICVVPVGVIVSLLLPGWIRNSYAGHSIWLAFVVAGFLLNLSALFMSREQNAARSAVTIGSIIVAAFYAVGFTWLFIATNGSPLAHRRHENQGREHRISRQG